MGWTIRPSPVAKTAALVVMLLAGGALTSCAPTQSALRGSDGPLPVEFTIFPWARALGSDPLASPPGANDYSCRPTPAHPNPVVLVHGFVATAAYWQTLAPLLANTGNCVYALRWINWNNRSRLHSSLNHVPLAEWEAGYPKAS